ncbi:GNAT family N-acetyltransferase [Bacillus sp. S/N-304-OC-R1]|uniref:GNAT family N-acetyltransferase n=1 Tax=Bacillus sp. S/N-304-OC-R1 TaxID=2758034 RepID=UPI001C8E0C40|nr:GNAT family N-acetyltransferase [Bacillus sp. S/N-304-OC-R1]MBY0123010.1 GNAT family N-acetyltransferase [Bacillus sp. S/N-304-OC-R1]
MFFQNGPLLIREIRIDDNHLLAKWLSDPIILEYYEGRDNPFDIKKVNKKFYNRQDGVNRCIIQFNQTPIGYIQFYELDHETREKYGYISDQRIIFGMDQFIGEHAYWNKGIGTMLVTSMINYLITEKHADLVVMDPRVQNERALRCYEKCGFRIVKLLPKNELHEGEYRDSWLIQYQHTN